MYGRSKGRRSSMDLLLSVLASSRHLFGLANNIYLAVLSLSLSVFGAYASRLYV